ncbi:MAG: 1-acyl-sn-glycerol-3-phosphate acyltransferase [Bacteroidia bacterium]|nr:1-acyl-sn-glycerol-3-phosphate acyltransferase [Bacteroidia bacterium]
MKNILYRIWSLWFYFLFVGLFVLIFPFFWILLSFKKPWTHNLAHKINAVWGRCITYGALVFTRSYGQRKLDKNTAYVFAPNHSSYLDIPVCNLAIRNQFRFMGKAELNKIPLFGWMFNRLHVAVQRESKIGSYRSFIKAQQKLQEGLSVLIFPEGTIPDKKKVTLGRFKDGAFRLAVENQVPLVPVSIIGTDRALPDDGKLLLHPGKVKVIFHDPIETRGLTLDDVPELKQKVFDLIHVTIAHG